MKKAQKKLALKRQTLRVLSGTDLQEVAGGTTIILVFSAPTIATTITVGGATAVSNLCAPDTNRNTTDLAGR